MHLSDSSETGAAELRKWSHHVDLKGIDVVLDAPVTKPDHTYHLRSLAAQVAAGIHVVPGSAAIRDLLREETDLEKTQFDTLVRVILGSLP